MKENPYLIGAGSVLAFACTLVLVQIGFKVVAIKLAGSDNSVAQSIGSGLGALFC